MLFDKLYPHQKEACEKLWQMTSGLLCDEMGLGKSLTILAVAERLGDACVVCPAYLKGKYRYNRVPPSRPI